MVRLLIVLLFMHIGYAEAEELPAFQPEDTDFRYFPGDPVCDYYSEDVRKYKEFNLITRPAPNSDAARAYLDLFSWNIFIALNMALKNDFATVKIDGTGESQDARHQLPVEEGLPQGNNTYTPRWVAWVNNIELEYIEKNRPWSSDVAYLDAANKPVKTGQYYKSDKARSDLRCDGFCLEDALEVGTNSGMEEFLLDRYGNKTYFEQRVSPKWMYGLWASQQDLLKDDPNERFSISWGDCLNGKEYTPAVALKLGWRVMTEQDDATRYMLMKGVSVDGLPG